MKQEELEEYFDYEVILKRMLEKIPDTLDKREGSIIYDALAPAAAEIAQMYIVLKNNIDLVFVDTAVEEYLDRLCNQVGITRTQATPAIKQGNFYDIDNNPMDINIGSRFTCENLYWVACEKISKGSYQMRCETAGVEGNNMAGNLVPVDYIKNLGNAVLTEVLIPGEDKESDNELRARYLSIANDIAFGGNIQDYKEKTKAIEGIGAVKVIPTWNGAGTVKLIILDSNYNKANDYLITVTQNKICPELENSGLGIAPIGHRVTVVTTNEKIINVSTTVTLSEDGVLSEIKENIKNSIEKYLLEIRKEWENSKSLIVRKLPIEALILDVDGVVDIQNTLLNDLTGNIEIEEMKIPVLGDLEVNT